MLSGLARADEIGARQLIDRAWHRGCGVLGSKAPMSEKEPMEVKSVAGESSRVVR